MLVVLKPTLTGTLWAQRLSAIFPQLLQGLNGLLERFYGHFDIGSGLNDGVQSSVICINGKSCVGGDTAFGMVNVQ